MLKLSALYTMAPLLGADLLGDNELQHIVSALIYSLLGVFLFSVVWILLAKITPFSIRKEIEDDQNTALGIILGAVIIGIALIISAAISG